MHNKRVCAAVLAALVPAVIAAADHSFDRIANVKGGSVQIGTTGGTTATTQGSWR